VVVPYGVSFAVSLDSKARSANEDIAIDRLVLKADRVHDGTELLAKLCWLQGVDRLLFAPRRIVCVELAQRRCSGRIWAQSDPKEMRDVLTLVDGARGDSQRR
jgi:hypothetical protein